MSAAGAPCRARACEAVMSVIVTTENAVTTVWKEVVVVNKEHENRVENDKKEKKNPFF